MEFEDLMAEDSEKDLEGEYKKIAREAENILITEVPRRIIKTIAQRISSTLLYTSDWMDFAAEIGLDRQLLLNEIENSANQRHERPLYIALCGPYSHNGTLGRIINALLNQRRMDVLHYIKEDVEGFLDDYGKKHLSSSNVDEKNDQCFLEPFLRSSYNSTVEALEKITVINCQSRPIRIIPWIQGQKRNIPISAFVPHAEEDLNTAQKLKKILQMADIDVKLLSQVEFMVAIGGCSSLSSILNQVDFIIPLLSPTYIRHIEPDANNMKKPDAVQNRFMHCYSLSEFVNNDCLNFRVRPVAMGLNSQQLAKLKRELLFSFVFQLWEDVERLVKILRDTKQNLPSISL